MGEHRQLYFCRQYRRYFIGDPVIVPEIKRVELRKGYKG